MTLQYDDISQERVEEEERHKFDEIIMEGIKAGWLAHNIDEKIVRFELPS